MTFNPQYTIPRRETSTILEEDEFHHTGFNSFPTRRVMVSDTHLPSMTRNMYPINQSQGNRANTSNINLNYNSGSLNGKYGGGKFSTLNNRSMMGPNISNNNFAQGRNMTAGQGSVGRMTPVLQYPSKAKTNQPSSFQSNRKKLNENMYAPRLKSHSQHDSGQIGRFPSRFAQGQRDLASPSLNGSGNGLKQYSFNTQRGRPINPMVNNSLSKSQIRNIGSENQIMSANNPCFGPGLVSYSHASNPNSRNQLKGSHSKTNITASSASVVMLNKPTQTINVSKRISKSRLQLNSGYKANGFGRKGSEKKSNQVQSEKQIEKNEVNHESQPNGIISVKKCLPRGRDMVNNNEDRAKPVISLKVPSKAMLSSSAMKVMDTTQINPIVYSQPISKVNSDNSEATENSRYSQTSNSTDRTFVSANSSPASIKSTPSNLKDRVYIKEYSTPLIFKSHIDLSVYSNSQAHSRSSKESGRTQEAISLDQSTHKSSSRWLYWFLMIGGIAFFPFWFVGLIITMVKKRKMKKEKYHIDPIHKTWGFRFKVALITFFCLITIAIIVIVIKVPKLFVVKSKISTLRQGV